MLRLTPAHRDAIQTREDWAAQILASAKETVKGFEYTRLSQTEDPHSEVWRCAKPRDSNYAHDLVITRYGIAAFGDMDPLVFSVGASYGMKFLAGDDVDYYIHSKLSADCKDVEFDPVQAEWVLATCVRKALDENWSDFECPEGAVLSARQELERRLDRGKPVGDGIDTLLRAMVVAAEPEWQQMAEYWRPRMFAHTLSEMVSSARGCRDPKELHDILEDHESELNCNFVDLFSDGLSVTRPSFNLLVRLHVLNIGAKRILEQQQLEAAAPPERQPWMDSYSAARKEKDGINYVVTKVAAKEFQLYEHEAQHLHGLLGEALASKEGCAEAAQVTGAEAPQRQRG